MGKYRSLIPRFQYLVTAFAVTLSSIIGGLTFTQNQAGATLAGFSAGNIMSDAVMADNSTMTVAQIQTFLKSKNSCNDTNLSRLTSYNSTTGKYGNYTYALKEGHFVCMADHNFNGKSAAQIIWQAAQDYKINPQVIIVLLQKEQALVTDTWPNNIQYASATGFNCPDDDGGCRDDGSGFTSQIRGAANLFREVLNGGWSNYPIGNNTILYNPSVSCGSSTVYIQNRATSALYRYTPYQPNAAALAAGWGTAACGAYGNRNFYNYFTDWFGSTQAPNVFTPTSSAYIQNGNYYIKNASKNLYIGGSATLSSSVTTWNITRDSRGYYTLKNASTGKVIDVVNGSLVNGTKLQTYASNNSCAQKWAAISYGSSLVFASKCSGRVIDITNGTFSNGTKLQIYDRNSSAAQRWTLEATNIPVAVDNGEYEILTHGDKHAFDVQNGSTASGAKVQVYDRNKSSAQKWQFTRLADGTYTVKSSASGKALDVMGASLAAGAKLQIYDSNNSYAQRWYVASSSGKITLTSALSGYVIDVSDGKITNGSLLQTYPSNNSSAQKFNTISASALETPAADTPPVADGTYTVRTYNGAFALDVRNGSTATGARAQIFNFNNSAAQKWQFTRLANGTYTIKNPKSNKVLDVMNGSTLAGAGLQIYPSNNSCAQKWIVKSIGSSQFNIRSACKNNLALDVKNGSFGPSNLVQAFTYNNSAAQRWMIK